MIDPKRLTEADKGREVFFADLNGAERHGLIVSWTENAIRIVSLSPILQDKWPHELAMYGTYQDGGTE